METKEIQKLIDFISQSGLDEVSVETNELKISVKRYSGNVTVAAPTVVAAPQPVAVAAPVAPAPTTTTAAAPIADDSKYVTIKSPMIGTFYVSPKQGANPFVNEGDDVASGKVVCIIEAMKLFNEIESEVSGKIVKVLVKDATPVEFDQPLFLVDPS